MTTQPNTTCTCPTGDGSLRWPCPVHTPAAAQEAVDVRSVIEGLLTLAHAAQNVAENADDGDGMEDVAVDRDDFDQLSDALDALDELPDDQPGHALEPAVKARWALRGLLAAPVTAALGIDLAALRARIVSAIERITSGTGQMRVPADLTDPDIVLADVLTLLDALDPHCTDSPKDGSEARDAARYRWLRESRGTTWDQPWVAVGHYGRPYEQQPTEIEGQQLDDAIDAAMQAQAGDAEVHRG